MHRANRGNAPPFIRGDEPLSSKGFCSYNELMPKKQRLSLSLRANRFLFSLSKEWAIIKVGLSLT